MMVHMQVRSCFGIAFQFLKSFSKQTPTVTFTSKYVFDDECSGHNITQTNTSVETCK